MKCDGVVIFDGLQYVCGKLDPTQSSAGFLHQWGWIEWGFFVAITFFVLVVLSMWLVPIYSVWAAHKQGQAELALALNEQQVQRAQAQGRRDAATLNKEAEIIDAEAVSKSVEIIGKSLHDNTGYLQWKWMHMMENTDNATIYVPTEANLPILEAGKRQ